jgi:hypothetical protein
MKKEKFFKKYSCPFCQLTSTRKYNLDVHIKRKHPQQQSQKELYPPYSSTNLYQYNEHLSEQTRQLLDSNNFIYEPTQEQYFLPTIMDNSYFEHLENQKKQEKRASERRFYQMINEFMSYLAVLNNMNNNNINIPIPYSPISFYNNTIPLFPQFSYIPNFTTINKSFDINSSIDPKKMPIAHKIYKCKICTTKTLLPIFDFEDTISSKNFKHNCIDDFSKYDNDVEYKGHSCGIYDSLVSIINGRINSEKIIVETFVLPQVLIQNPLCLFIFQIIQNIFDLNSIIVPSWILKLLKVDKFIDLGEIDSEHWACRCYDSQDGIIVLEKEELQHVIKTLNATFAVLTFEINNSRKFIFCYIPLNNKLNPR